MRFTHVTAVAACIQQCRKAHAKAVTARPKRSHKHSALRITDRVTESTMEERSRRAASLADAECSTECSDPITAAIADALAEQKRYFEMMMDGQMKAFQACMQTFVETTNTRTDGFVKGTTRVDGTEGKLSVLTNRAARL